MPQPTLGSVHTNAALDNVAIGFKNAQYVLNGVCPTIPVAKESDYYYTWDQGALFRNEAKVVRPGDIAPRSGFSFSSATYTTQSWEFGWAIPDRVRANMDAAISAEINAVGKVMDKIEMAREISIASVITGTTWTGATSTDVGGDWDGAGTPVDDVEAHVSSIQGKIGLPPNTIIMSWKVYRALRKHNDILSRLGISAGQARAISAQGVNVVNRETLAAIFDIPNVVIVPGVYNTAAEGQTASYSAILTDTVWIGYVASAPALDEPSAMYCFQVSAPTIRSYREESRKQDIVEGAVNFVCKATSTVCGGLLTNCLA